jgi:hypothetical protein
MKRLNGSAHSVGTTITLAVCFAAIGTVAAHSQQVERYELSGSEIAIYNLAGEITLQAGGGSTVVVEVARGGRDAADLRIETGSVRGLEALRIIYPDERIVYPALGRRSRTELRVRADGTFGDSGDWNGRSRGDRVRISGDGDGLEAYADLTVSIPAGKHIEVYLAAGEASVTGVDGDIRMDTHSAPVRASGTRGSLVVDVGSGSVVVSDAEGDLDVDTGSGSVEVTAVNGTSLLIDTGSGSVRGSDISVGDLDIDTGSGRIEVDGVTASSIRLDTGSGSISLELLRDADDIEIDTGSGGVTLVVPDSFGSSVEIDTGSGGIEVDLPLTMRRWDRDHVTGTIGDGQGRLMIDTGSGSVRIRRG